MTKGEPFTIACKLIMAMWDLILVELSILTVVEVHAQVLSTA